MKSEWAKVVVYLYTQDPKDGERVVDLRGDLPIYEKGDIIGRNGMQWKVQNVDIQQSTTDPKASPTHWIYLAPVQA